MIRLITSNKTPKLQFIEELTLLDDEESLTKYMELKSTNERVNLLQKSKAGAGFPFNS